MDENYININDVKEQDVSFMPSRIQFNNYLEWKEFYNKYEEVLRMRRDWYFNINRLQLVQ